MDTKRRGAFTAVATLLAETPAQRFDMAQVLRFFARGDGREALDAMVNERRASGDPRYSQIAVDGIDDYVNGSADQVGGIRKMTSTRLQSWFNPRIQAATASSDFDLQDIRRKPMTIYVRVQPGNIARMRPLLALFFDALINLNTDATPEEDPTIQHQVLVLMDEFIRFGHVLSMAEAAQYIRGYGFRLVYIVQNKAQVRGKYGEDGAADIFDNCGVEIIFGTNDLKLTQELADRMGDDTINVVTQNRPKFFAWFNPSKQSEAEHPHRRPLMLAQEVARMAPEDQIVLRAGMLPIKTQRARWWNDQHFTRMVRPAPTIPALNITIALDDGRPRNKGSLPDITAADVEPLVEDEMEDADAE